MLNRFQIALVALLIAFGVAATFAVVTTIKSDPMSRAAINKGHVG